MLIRCSLIKTRYNLFVLQAYRNFGNKVKVLKRKLDELIPTLSDSPIPSPDANAPSPSPDSDLDFSSQQKSKRESTKEQSVDNNSLDFSFVNSTFMGNSQFLDINFQVIKVPSQFLRCFGLFSIY